MKIPSNPGSPLRPASFSGRAHRAEVRSTEAGVTRRGGEPAERVRPDADGSAGQSPAERIQALGEKVHERLEALAQRTGLDLSDVEAAFDHNLERLLGGLADGSLSRDDLTQGIENILQHLRDDVSERLDPRGDAADPGAPQARIEALTSSVEERVLALAEELGGAQGAGLEQALDAFGVHVDRLLAGLEEGSLDRHEVASGLQNVLDLVRQDVQRGLGETDQGRQDDGSASGLERRFESFVGGVDERLAGMQVPPDQADAFARLQAEFSSAMDRLGSAFFEEGSIGRGQFQDLFGSLFADLRQDVQGLFGDQQDAGRASLYHPVTGVERLGGGLPGGLDATV
jgi:hypothetical protein